MSFQARLQCLRESAEGLQIKGLVEAFETMNESEFRNTAPDRSEAPVQQSPQTLTQVKRLWENSSDLEEIGLKIVRVEGAVSLPACKSVSTKRQENKKKPQQKQMLAVNQADQRVANHNQNRSATKAANINARRSSVPTRLPATKTGANMDNILNPIQPQQLISPYQQDMIVGSDWSMQESARAIIVLANGAQRIVTFTLPARISTARELLGQLKLDVPILPTSEITCQRVRNMNPGVSYDYLITVDIHIDNPAMQSLLLRRLLDL